MSGVDPDLAIREYERQLTANPSDDDARFCLAGAYWENERYWDAAATYATLIDRRRETADTEGLGRLHAYRALNLLSSGRRMAALREFEGSVQCGLDRPFHLRSLADFHLRNRQYRSALEEFRMAAASDEGHILGEAQALIGLGRHDEAAEVLQTDPERADPGLFTESAVGSLWSKKRDPDQALRAYRLAVERHPTSSMAMARLAHALIDCRRHDEALPLLAKSLEMDPDNAYALLFQAYVKVEHPSGGPEQAEALLDKLGASGFDDAGYFTVRLILARKRSRFREFWKIGMQWRTADREFAERLYALARRPI